MEPTVSLCKEDLRSNSILKESSWGADCPRPYKEQQLIPYSQLIWESNIRPQAHLGPDIWSMEWTI